MQLNGRYILEAFDDRRDPIGVILIDGLIVLLLRRIDHEAEDDPRPFLLICSQRPLNRLAICRNLQIELMERLVG